MCIHEKKGVTKKAIVNNKSLNIFYKEHSFFLKMLDLWTLNNINECLYFVYKTELNCKAKKDFEAVLDTVNYNDGPIIIGRQNNNDAVIMSLAHYNGLMETLYLLKSSANAAHLAKSVEQYESSKLNSKTK